MCQADGCEEQLTAYLPLPLEVEVYLDAPDSNTITAKVLCSYGEEKIDPYGEAKPSTDRRDRIGETRARLVLQRHFPHYDPDLGVLVLRGDDDAIYRFLTDGAAEIGTVAAVYATDAYRNIGIDPPPRVSVGVSLNSRLLDLTIDTDGIDPEELGGVLEDYRRGRRFHRLKTGRYVTLDESALAGLAQIADGWRSPTGSCAPAVSARQNTAQCTSTGYCGKMSASSSSGTAGSRNWSRACITFRKTTFRCPPVSTGYCATTRRPGTAG